MYLVSFTTEESKKPLGSFLQSTASTKSSPLIATTSCLFLCMRNTTVLIRTIKQPLSFRDAINQGLL